MSDRVLRIFDAQSLAIQHDLNFDGLLDAEDRPCHFRAACPHQSGKSEHFTLRDFERNPVVRISESAQSAHFETDFAVST